MVQADWVHNLKGSQASGQPKWGIFATVHTAKKGEQRFGYWNANVALVRSDDHFETQKVLVKGGNRFLFTSKFMFVARQNAIDCRKYC